jgi:ankyrin repeat protein
MKNLRGFGFPVLLAVALASPAGVQAQGTVDIIDAAKRQDRGALHRLLADGANVNVTQGDGATALHWAVHRDDARATRLLLASGANVNAVNALGATPLWLAAINGSASLAGALLEAGADPNVSLKGGETPLMTAARSGSRETVEHLVAWGGDVNAAEYERGQTALMWAVAQRHADVAALLLAAGADLNARTKVWRQLENTAGNTNPIGNFRMAHGGSTAMLFAARNGDIETVRVLLDYGANIGDVAASGTSALVVAAHSGHEALGKFLLEQGSDPNEAEAGYTALHAAVLRSEVELVRALLKHGADIDAVVERGTPGRRFSADFSIRYQAVGASAFWLAAKYGELETLRLLADHGANPFITPDNGVSVLQAAMGVPAISQENRRNRVGVPLAEASEREALVLELARVVIDLGAEVNAVDERGNTALHDAVRVGFTQVVDFLLNHGADVDLRNNRDQTPLVLAETPLPVAGTNGRRATQPEIAALLRRVGVE